MTNVLETQRTCAVEGCDDTYRMKSGWCNRHYLRWYRHGDPLATSPRATMEERFWSKVDVGHPLGCWMWTGAPNPPGGYGRFALDGNTVRIGMAHRVAYELLVGPIPDGLHIDHLCRVHLCVNPDHLEPVTQAENNLRSESRNAKNARKTQCQRGHAFTEANTYRNPGSGSRACRACQRIWQVNRRLRASS